MTKCEWENCDSDVYDQCGLCGLRLCEYHFIHSESHDALDQREIDLTADLDDDDLMNDDEDDWR